jgi:hypothetical protein
MSPDIVATSTAERCPIIASSGGASVPPWPLNEWQSEQRFDTNSWAPLAGSPMSVTGRFAPPMWPAGADC